MNTRLIIPLALLLLAPVVTGAAQPAVVTLEDCLRESLRFNHGVLARSAEFDAADARSRVATANRLPRFGIQASALHTTDPLRVRPITTNGELGVFSQDTWQVAATAGVPLYAGGRLAAEQEAARLLADATGGDLTYARQALAVRVVSVFHDALAVRAVIESLDQSRETLGAQLERIDAMLRQQKAAEVDRLRVAVRLAQVEQGAIEARSRLEILEATLAVLMGRDPSERLDLRGKLPVPTDTPLTQPIALEARADEVAARRRAEAAMALERAVRAAYRPTLEASAAWGPRSDFEGNERFETGFAGLTLSWSIWDLGRTAARVHEARATARARTEIAMEIQMQRRLELASAEAGARSAAARIEASRLAVEQARESLRIEQRKYDLGQGTITDVLASQAASVEADSLRARAQADHATSLAARDLALARIFTGEADTPALRADPAADASTPSGATP